MLADRVLEVEGARVEFGGIVAVDDVSIDVAPGEIVGLIGPNGAGKSTLLDAISGFARLSKGQVRLDGRDVTSLLAYQRARLGIGRSFQDARLYPTMTVREVLRTAFHPLQRHGVFAEGLRLPLARREEKSVARAAEELLEIVDLHRYLDYRISELSFGTTRAVELAWVAARRPAILLLDEPASGLQQSEVRALGALIEKIRRGAAVVLVDHDVPFVSGVASRLIAMNLGQVVADGTPKDVLNDDAVIACYLGTGRYAGLAGDVR